LALPLDRAWTCRAGSRDTTGEDLLANVVPPTHLNPAKVELVTAFDERLHFGTLRW